MDPAHHARVSPARPGGSPDRLFAGRYSPRRLLKRGDSFESYYGVDLESQQAVVIKTVAAATVSSGLRMRLEHDAEILRKIDSPLLAPLLRVGTQDDLFYLVSRYQEGTSLESVLRERRLSLTETLLVARCVLYALAEAHEHGVVHRDVKPANVILHETDPVRRAVLVDFGLAPGSQVGVTARELRPEAARYLSPEQAGAVDVEVSARSDLYSLGIVLYECLSGRPPFDGTTIGDVLRQHTTQTPVELRGLGLDVPRVLDDVIQRLLRKDPRDRYQLARAVAADLLSIGMAVRRGEAEPALVVGRHDRREDLTEPAFVGREKELDALAAQLRKARAGRGRLALLEAESGGGKTRLLDELALRCEQQDAWVLRGQAMDQIGQQPLQVLEGIGAEIEAACRADPERARGIREAVGDRLDAIVAAQPRLATLLDAEPSESLGPEAFGEARTVEALVTFLGALGTSERPALVLLDDCQWADEATLKLLRRWQARRRMDRSTPCHVLLVAAFRSEEVHEGHVLRSLSPALHLRLPLFDSNDVRQIVESMAGRLPQEAVEVIVRLSDGSPFMASAVLRGMVEARALIFGDQGWRVERSAMDDVRSSRHAAEVLARRISLLPRLAIDLLRVAAVLGKEFELSLAASLAELLPGHAVVALRQAQQRHLVWTSPHDEKCLFVHDKVRDTCLALLKPEERRDLHLRAAAELEQRESPPIFDLAYHYDVAGQSERALPYALEAAELARGRYALEIAEQQYRIALRGSTEADQATCYRIAEGLGDMLMLRGRYDAAWQMFEAAKFLALGDVPLVKAKIEGKLGELIFKRGDMKSTAEAIERGLRHLGGWVPRTAGPLWLLLPWEVGVQLVHTVLPHLFVGRRQPEGAEKALLSVRLWSRLGHAYWFARGSVATLWAHLRELNLAERYGPTLELAQAYSEHAPAMSLLARYGRGIKYAEKSLAIRREFGDFWGQAQSLHYYGIVLYAASRFQECIDKCREAVRLFERTGDFWEMNMARYQIAASLYRLGNLSEAVAEAKRLHKSGLELGDVQASGISLDVWAWASGGKVPADVVRAELAHPRDDAQATAQVLVAEGVRLLASGHAGEAVKSLGQARQVIQAAGVRNAWTAPILPWLATALRRQAEDDAGYTPQRRHLLLREAESVVGRALRLTRSFRNDRPHALREKALLRARRGKGNAARRWFDRSLAEAQQQGARYEYAQSLLYRGQVGRELGWPAADDHVAEAERLLAGLREGLDPADAESSEGGAAPATLSLVDRFDAVLDAGREVASSLNHEAVFQTVWRAALRLLRGEECSIWCVPTAVAMTVDESDAAGTPRAPAQFGAGDPAAACELVVPAAPDRRRSADLVRMQVWADRALHSGRTVVSSEHPDPGPADPEQADAFRSALATPIFVRGEPAACFCVVHRQITALFGDDEQRLAEFIAALAGAALENAAGFEQLQRLNANLEQRVAERTADLQARTAELARSNSELQQFAYAASHDLQEPLRTVTGYCRLLEEHGKDQPDEKAREYLHLAVEGATRMKALISDLLAFARVGRDKRSFQPTDGNLLWDQAVANLRVVLDETGAQVTRDSLPRVLVDGTLLMQVFQNLIDNAVKFRAPDVRPEIHGSARRRGDEWEFSVRDNGIGISPEDHERVFLVFHRLHGTKHFTGTGIGLALCKKTVEYHGGRIWVESRESKGSTFYFTLPVSVPLGQMVTGPSPATPPDPAPDASGGH